MTSIRDRVMARWDRYVLGSRWAVAWRNRRRIRQLLNSQKPLHLHLGCGRDYKPGYVNIDVNPQVGADIVSAAEDLSVFPDGIAASIEAYHVFEHFHLHQARQALREWHRLLAPGGTLHLELPNLDRAYAELGKHFDEDVDLAMGGLYGDPRLIAAEGLWQVHKWGWVPSTLERELRDAGFTDVQQQPIRQTWRKAAAFQRDMHLQATRPSKVASEPSTAEPETA